MMPIGSVESVGWQGRDTSDTACDRQPTRRLAPLAVFLCVVGMVMGSALVVGQGRPFRLDGLDGSSLGPTDLDRGVVIAVVWATWSPHSRNVVGQVDAIVERWGDRAKVIMVDFQEDRSAVEEFLRGQSPRAQVFLDQSGAFSKRYSVTNLPGLVIFKDGNAAFSGKLSRNPDSIISQTLD